MPKEIAAGPVVLRWTSTVPLDELMDAIRESYAELHQWMSWAQEMPTPEGMSEWLSEVEAHYEAGDDFRYGMCDAVTGKFLGGCGAMRRVAPAAIEIGYWIRTSETRKGYCTAGIGAVVEAIFTHLPDVERIEIYTDEANSASRRVAQKLGFVPERTVDWAIESPGQTGRRIIWAQIRNKNS